MMVPQRKTVDGFEEHFGLNYLGHFLLTRLLLDSLSQSGRAGRSTRVVTVSSATHYVAELALDDLQSRCVRARHGPGHRGRGQRAGSASAAPGAELRGGLWSRALRCPLAASDAGSCVSVSPLLSLIRTALSLAPGPPGPGRLLFLLYLLDFSFI